MEACRPNLHILKWRSNIIEIDILMKYFIFDEFFFYPKSLVVCPLIVLSSKYMVLATICYKFIAINIRLVYEILHKLTLLIILLFKCKYHSLQDFGLFISFLSVE